MGQYDKYICTTLQKRNMLPGPTPEERDKLAAQGKRISMEHILWIDNEVIPGAYYGESTYIWPSTYPGQITREEQMKLPTNDKPMFPHAHDFPEPVHKALKVRRTARRRRDHQERIRVQALAGVPAEGEAVAPRPWNSRELLRTVENELRRLPERERRAFSFATGRDAPTRRPPSSSAAESEARSARSAPPCGSSAPAPRARGDRGADRGPQSWAARCPSRPPAVPGDDALPGSRGRKSLRRDPRGTNPNAARGGEA